MADTTGQSSLRAENISALVKGFALQSYKLKGLCMVDKSNAWTESYYRETATELTGGSQEGVRGIPRLAQFPYGEVSWTKVSSYIEKYGMEGIISWEDENTNNIPALARTLLRIGRAVANAIDIQIESVIKANNGNSVAITAGSEWDASTLANRDPISDILHAVTENEIDNYDMSEGGYLLVNPTDWTHMLMNSKVVNNPSFKTADVVSNGRVGQIAGLTVVKSNVISVSNAYVVKAKEALTWKEAQPLTVVTIDDPGIKKTVRAFELGVCQVPNPNAICKITGTKL